MSRLTKHMNNGERATEDGVSSLRSLIIPERSRYAPSYRSHVSQQESMAIINPDEKQFAQLFGGLVNLYDAAYREEPQQTYRTEYGTSQYVRWLYHGDPHGFFVLVEGGQPIGFLSLHSRWQEKSGRVVGELHEVVVLPGWQGKGVGAELLRQADVYALRQGRDVITLWVGENNIRAARIYKRMGFQVTRRHGPWIRMEKRLTSEQ